MKMFTEDGPVSELIIDAQQIIILTKAYLELLAKSDGIDESLMGTANAQREAAYLIATNVQKIVDFYESLT